MQNKFSANLPRLPPSPMLPTVVGSPLPTPLPSPKHEKSAWFSPSPYTSPRSSLSSATHPVRLDDYKFARPAQPAPVGGLVGFGVRQLLQRRGRWVILLAILATSAFMFLCAPSYHDLRITPLSSSTAGAYRADPVVPIPGSGSARKSTHRGGSWRKPMHKSAVLELGPSEELAVLTAYLAALPENRIPNVNPATPLDPQLVVDFDTRSSTAKEELAEVVHDVWHRNPVVLFGKMLFTDSREVRGMVEKLNLLPGPTVFNVDERPDADVLEQLLYRLTNATSLPILLIGGVPVGGLAEVKVMDAEGTLPRLIEIAGAKIDGKKKKGGRKH